MKKTGIMRRIDSLGRIVIPKEIRSSLHIKESDKLEIYLDENENIMLKKDSTLKNKQNFLYDFLYSIYNINKKNVLITDKDKIIVYLGKNKDEYLNKRISQMLDSCLVRRVSIMENYKKEITIVDDNSVLCTYIIKSIISNGDVIGLFIMFSTSENEMINKTDDKIADIATNFLSKYLEE